MTKEELRKEATTTVEWECTPMINRPLFVHAYIIGAEPREKRIEELEKENAKQIEQIADLKNYCCEVSKYLHDNSMVSVTNSTMCKKRDALLIKEFKLCEKWGDLR